eukprot:1628722-Amphidinium_carterae.1
MSRESNEPKFESSSAEKRKLRKQRSKTLSSSVKRWARANMAPDSGQGANTHPPTKRNTQNC